MLGRVGQVARPGVSSLFSVPPASSGSESGRQALLIVSCEVLAHRFSL